MKPHKYRKPFGKDEPMDVKRYWFGILTRFLFLVIILGIVFWLWSQR